MPIFSGNIHKPTRLSHHKSTLHPPTIGLAAQCSLSVSEGQRRRQMSPAAKGWPDAAQPSSSFGGSVEAAQASPLVVAYSEAMLRLNLPAWPDVPSPSCVMSARCLVSGGPPGTGLPRKDTLNADLRMDKSQDE